MYKAKMKVSKKLAKPSNVLKSRKQERMDKRKARKARRHDYYTNRNTPGRFVLNPDFVNESNAKVVKSTKIPKKQKVSNMKINAREQTIINIAKEKRDEMKLKTEMQKQRARQMIEANIEEDKNIAQLEKQLKLKKKSKKSIANTFAADGLDYLLEVCDSDNMKDILTSEVDMHAINDNFDEDLALMTGKIKNKPYKKKRKIITDFDVESIEDQNRFDEEMEVDADEDTEEDTDEDTEEDTDEDTEENTDEDTEENTDIEEENNTLDDVSDIPTDSELLLIDPWIKSENMNDDNDVDVNASSDVEVNEQSSLEENKTWQDIYGRFRDQAGNVVEPKTEKYIPPGARAGHDTNNSTKIIRLKRLLKGSLNRLAESNMHSITNQIENLYMTNSRNDMNQTLTGLIADSIITNIISPERLLLEHVLLIIILHANVGSEVGAHFLQFCVKMFDELITADGSLIEDKRLDNVVNIIAQLYNFKLFSSKLLYDILTRLSVKFEEKHVECILNVLKHVGFTLRKEDPVTLKNLILSLQSRAGAEAGNDNPRVKFMLDILLAIKNNNVNKIPNYDTSYSEHLKKISKSFIRKGNYVTQLNIGLDDLLKAEERGKWWVVGSAWTGKLDPDSKEPAQLPQSQFSQKLLKLAKKQRMNTDTRRNVFCIIMSAEDYMDAFEKLLHLGLKNQQEREIINVLLHCCLSEKQYNPYYSILAQKFCDYDRKFQMMIKFSIWDKVKTLVDCSPAQISNLAKLLTHLFVEKGLPISTLKVVQFGELDKTTMRFMVQILMGVLLTRDLQQCQEVFQRVAQSEKLKMFRESLRLFIHHFLLRNLDSNDSKIGEDEKQLLGDRARFIEQLLSASDKKSKLV